MSPIEQLHSFKSYFAKMQLKLIIIGATKPAKEAKLDDCPTALKIQPSNFKIVQVIHLRCCYNILAALQESYDCELL